MVIRPATASDLDGVSAVFEAIHDAETAHGRGSGAAGKTYRLRKTPLSSDSGVFSFNKLRPELLACVEQLQRAEHGVRAHALGEIQRL